LKYYQVNDRTAGCADTEGQWISRNRATGGTSSP